MPPPGDESCLYVALRSPQELHDRLLRELVAPFAREIREHPDLDSLFFVRYAEPSWELRFRVLGRPRWIEGTLRAALERALRDFVLRGEISGLEFGAYAREWERYGGPRGMRLAERIFLHDSLACLDLLEAEARGAAPRPRRQYSLVFTERLLDLFDFDPERRHAFYREGHAWAFRDGVFRNEDLPALERRYASARPALEELLFGSAAQDPARQLGGPEPARIATHCLEALRPLAREIASGVADRSISQDLVHLVWSYAHLHCNRLGIEVVPEAILRYLMFRLYEDRS